MSADQLTPSLDVIHVASPCSVPWESMDGDERVRHCSKCEMNVYDLTELSRDEAEDLVFSAEGRTCVRFFRRSDGKVITKDCPVGLRTLRRQLSRAIMGIAAMIAFLTCGLIFGGEEALRRGGRREGPLTRFSYWLNPQEYPVAGALCIPAPPAVPGPGGAVTPANPIPNPPADPKNAAPVEDGE